MQLEAHTTSIVCVLGILPAVCLTVQCLGWPLQHRDIHMDKVNDSPELQYIYRHPNIGEMTSRSDTRDGIKEFEIHLA